MKKIINIFLEPSAVFKELRKESGWLLPLCIILIITFIFTYLLYPTVILSEQIKQINSNNTLSPEQKAQSIDYLQGKTPYIMTMVTSLITPILFILFISLVVMVIGSVLGGEKVAFKNIFAAVSYIGLIDSFDTVYTGIIMYTQNTMDAALNLALFLPEVSGILHKLFTSINFFGIWQVVLLAILLQVFYKFSRKKAFTVMFGLWFAWKLIFAFIPIPGVG